MESRSGSDPLDVQLGAMVVGQATLQHALGTLGTHERPKTMPSDATGNPDVKPAWLPVWCHRSCYSRPCTMPGKSRGTCP